MYKFRQVLTFELNIKGGFIMFTLFGITFGISEIILVLELFGLLGIGASRQKHYTAAKEAATVLTAVVQGVEDYSNNPEPQQNKLIKTIVKTVAERMGVEGILKGAVHTITKG